MTKIFSAADLAAKTLRELTAIYNEYAPTNRGSVFSCSKDKAVDAVLAVLPEAPAAKKANGKNGDSKVGRLVAALKSPKSAEALMEISGFDRVNLGVSISILRKKKGMNIRFDKAAKTYLLHA